MEDEFKKYIKANYIVTSCYIDWNKNISKKTIIFPKKWQESTLNTKYIPQLGEHNNIPNGLIMLTGKVNNIFVIDVDNLDNWNNLLKDNNKKEPKTVKAISGNGGLHYYFKYNENLNLITSKTDAIYDKSKIDIRSNGGCIIIPPSSYLKKKYKWEKNIFDNELKEVPKWLLTLLLAEKKDDKKKQSINKLKAVEPEIDIEDENINFTSEDIENLVNMLSVKRCENYNDWINVGMCIYNLSKLNLYIWKKWSKQSGKYEDNACELKWKSFKKSKDGYKIGSLLLWCKSDNNEQYNSFMQKKKLNIMMVAKFPDKKLILGETLSINEHNSYTKLQNNECIFYGNHNEPSMYIELIKDLIGIKCRNPECFGKVYPCKHSQLTKQEMNLVFNGNIQININCNDDELIDFKKINLFDDEELNELVYNGLNGKSTPYAEIMYYLNKSKYVYSESNAWFVYNSHRWKCIETKNTYLRRSIQIELKQIYTKVMDYYMSTEGKQSKKVKLIQQINNNFDDTVLKNNIMTEVIDIYLEKNNKNRDFMKKLDNNDYYIGFNNGVYDLKSFTFRDGQPNDYITMNTGYDYIDNYSKNHPKLLQFLNDIQPNKEELDYLLTYISTSLFGNTLELFTVLTGSGRNGKSKLIELLTKTFGEYFGSIKGQVLTSQIKDGDAPAPGILDLLHKKIVIASETLEGAKLNSGFIKFITGRDTASFRLCHQNNMIDFSAKFITLLACNTIPECDNMDNAFSKRLRCINFPTEFVDENPVLSHHKLKDDMINMYFDDWKQDFMLLLINYYKTYSQTKKLIPTKNILAWTEQYKENTDKYLSFLNENTIQSESHVHIVMLYATFKEWYKTNNPNTKIPNNKDFVNGIKKYKNVEKVRVDDKVQLGIKQLDLNYE
jgi:P4 family phage/plasmid primase-like protien